jgi:hypothetical protein
LSNRPSHRFSRREQAGIRATQGEIILRIAALLISLVGLTACSGSMKEVMDDISKLDPFAKDTAKKESPKKAAPTQQVAPKPAPQPTAQPGFMDNPLGSLGKIKTTQKTTTKTSSAHCCVNGAYYTCPSGGAAAQCVGQPMQLMSCVRKCGFKSGCDQDCARQHGPDPSACQRNPSKDGQCKKR